ncbi:phosphatidylserine decarboxylase-domain-containing protein [Syncephalis plumigaleata]|nr:phosphatidylserine decarboxylase-domain-containing protein [Syncephalis plumigaleata]
MLTTRLAYRRGQHFQYALTRYARTQHLRSLSTATIQHNVTSLASRQCQRRTFATSSSPKSRSSRLVHLSLLVTGLGIGYVAGNAYLNPKGVVGPWQVHFATALPLKGLSRFFGWFNELTLPMWFRRPGLRFYAWLFGCNLDEMKDPNLMHYDNLADFFYRELRDDARPIDDTSILVSPADGRVLHYGVVVGRQVEQVKGVTYSLDAFLGTRIAKLPHEIEKVLSDTHSSSVAGDREFAEINGISYTLDELLSGGTRVETSDHDTAAADTTTAIATTDYNSTVITTTEDQPRPDPVLKLLQPGNRLYYCVIYLAPGDYHRFHSPTNWVIHSRRHFGGELYSVSPYMANILKDLFVLNERVALFGRWRHGFFSMTPVGATNELATNRVEKHLPYGTFTEASYASFSQILGGKVTKAGEEIGGFRLGSTIVLLFEAPESFEFTLTQNQKVLVGQSIGRLKDTRTENE